MRQIIGGVVPPFNEAIPFLTTCCNLVQIVPAPPQGAPFQICIMG